MSAIQTATDSSSSIDAFVRVKLLFDSINCVMKGRVRQAEEEMREVQQAMLATSAKLAKVEVLNYLQRLASIAV